MELKSRFHQKLKKNLITSRQLSASQTIILFHGISSLPIVLIELQGDLVTRVVRLLALVL
jgi:hypothetical protein